MKKFLSLVLSVFLSASTVFAADFSATYGASNHPVLGEYLSDVAKGLIPGQSVLTIPGRKESISTTQLEDICDFVVANGVVPRPGGIQLEVVSSSTSDDGAPAGVGSQTVNIVYLDVNFDQQTEVVTLDGTTPVTTTATDIEDVQWMDIATIGSTANGTSVGTITLRGVGAGTTYSSISAGGNQSLCARYKIPNNMTGYILGWHYTAVAKAVDFRLRANVDRLTRAVQTPFLFQDSGLTDVGNSPHIPMYGKVPELGTVKASGKSTAAGGDGSATFFLLLIED